MKVVFENRKIAGYALGRFPVSGGAERQQWLLARALARRGHEVVVYSLEAAPAPAVTFEGVRFESIAPAAPLRAWPKILREERPDWWYRRCADPYLGLLAPFVRAAGSRLVYACAFDSDCRPRRAGLRRRHLWPLYAAGLHLADRILVQHRGQLDLLSPRLRRKARLVPSIAGDSPPAPRREGYVAWVGLLREPKKPHLVAELAERLPGVRFVVCGAPTLHRSSAGYAASIEARLRSRPNLDYRGKVPPDEAQRVIAAAGVLLSTSAEEGFPNTFLQAWGAGVPVVSMGIDPGGVLAERRSGVVTDGVDAAAAAIADLLADGERNAELGRNGLAYVREHHSEGAAVARFEEALGEAAGTRA